MKEYGYLDYGTIAPPSNPALLPPGRHINRLLQNRNAPHPISPQFLRRQEP